MSAWPATEAISPRSTHVDALASCARAAVAAQDRAVSIRTACESLLVRILRRPLTIGDRRHAAMLVPVPDGFHAIVDSEIWNRAANSVAARRRLRFVLAHELGHTFFYRPGRPPSRATAPD